MRRLALVVLAVLLSAAAVVYAQQRPRAIPLDEVFRTGVGRFQVTNPTPDVARNAMLVDTTSGATWILCSDAGRTAWCKMVRHDEATTGKLVE